MKPIIFARVADMKYYRGITDDDKPYNGGSFVADTGYAHECYNFDPMVFDGDSQEYCLGYCQLPGYSRDGKPIELHIEKMPGCELMKKEDKIEDAIVVFCSKAVNSKTMRAVGFYKHATVFRWQQECCFGEDYCQFYSFMAKKEDCVLLPYKERFSQGKWYVPSANKNHSSFGYGRSHIWYGGKSDNPDEVLYVNRMIENVETYDGENWMDCEVKQG